jgi:sugar O-acyltransferase (sialic acid O-acetyltransferase NeuD family)
VRADPAQQFTPPASVRRILIVGAGGFGREVLHWARDAWPDHAAKIAGFLSADPARRVPLPILGDPAHFRPEPGDAFLLAIGIPGVRRQVAEMLLAHNAAFLTLVHPTAIVAPSAAIGPGSILCPHAIASDSVSLGRFTLMNYHSSLGHDASTGDFAVLSPYATLGGGAAIAEDVFLGLHASVGPGRTVGPRSKVTANSAVLQDAAAECLVFGVPGCIHPLLKSAPGSERSVS